MSSAGNWRELIETEALVRAGGCDLHLHSSASDGTLSAADLARASIEAGLRYVCLTDHDTLAGQEEFLRALRELSGEISALVGVELSTTYDFRGRRAELHLLAYFGDLNQALGLQPYLDEQLRLRRKRNFALLARLQELGYQLSDDFAAGLEGDALIARPHFALELVARGYVSSVAAAFEELLGEGRPAYLDVSRPQLGEAISKIHEAGGLAVLAHPQKTPFFDFSPLYGLSERSLDFGRSLKRLGLDGIEVWHGDATRTEQLGLAALAHSVQLPRTAGSDFHGSLCEREIYRGDRQFLRREYIVTAACLWRGDQIFLAERAPGEYSAGFYEFPGGKLEAGEDFRTALLRELDEELGLELDLAAIPELPSFFLAAERDDSNLYLALFELTLPNSAKWQLHVHSQGGFYTIEEARELNLLPLDRPLLEQLRPRASQDSYLG